ncbi:MAG: amino acid permease [Rhabdochlamydiaceae bacterium]
MRINSFFSNSVWGAIFLIAGSCIGAGMLALPIVTGQGGFIPSIFTFFLAWFFMTSTALLLVEVNSWSKKETNFLSMVHKTLGSGFKIISFFIYAFLFYSLMVAYLSSLNHFFSSLNFFPYWLGTLSLVLIFAFFIYRGTKCVDISNRCLMVGKLGCYFIMCFLLFPYISVASLSYMAPIKAFSSLPVLIVAFGFHNIIPTLFSYLNGDLKKVRLAVIGGSSLAFCIYLFWEFLVLSTLPLEGSKGISEALLRGYDSAYALSLFLEKPLLQKMSQGLSIFAMLTALLTQALSFHDFLKDGLKTKSSPLILIITLIPPFICSCLFPSLFFKALGFAGGVCAIVLFGIIPILMVWRGRYTKKIESLYTLQGGKVLLSALFILALSLLVFQLIKIMSD